MLDISDLRRIHRIQRWEFWLSMICFGGVALFGAIPGIVLAIVIAVIGFLWDGWRRIRPSWAGSPTYTAATTWPDIRTLS